VLNRIATARFRYAEQLDGKRKEMRDLASGAGVVNTDDEEEGDEKVWVLLSTCYIVPLLNEHTACHAFSLSCVGILTMLALITIQFSFSRANNALSQSGSSNKGPAASSPDMDVQDLSDQQFQKVLAKRNSAPKSDR